MSLFFLFLDGVGIGEANGEYNPFFSGPLPGFESLLGGPMVSLARPERRGPPARVIPLDAALGVEGLPQSGTGQVSLLTGENAAAILGRHFGPYPHSRLRDLLGERNLFRQLAGEGVGTAYLNAFPRQYHEHVERSPGRTGAISLAWRLAGGTLAGKEELIAGRAISADITSAGWSRLGHPEVPAIRPSDAAAAGLRAMEEHGFVLFEYYLTDHAGHGRPRAVPGEVLGVLDEFVGALWGGMDRRRQTLVVTSDHGNFEDLSTRSHTRNPVPFIAAGRRRDRLVRGLRDLAGVAGSILNHYR